MTERVFHTPTRTTGSGTERHRLMKANPRCHGDVRLDGVSPDSCGLNALILETYECGLTWPDLAFHGEAQLAILPDAIAPILAPFATLVTSSSWRKAQMLLVGVILT